MGKLELTAGLGFGRLAGRESFQIRFIFSSGSMEEKKMLGKGGTSEQLIGSKAMLVHLWEPTAGDKIQHRIHTRPHVEREFIFRYKKSVELWNILPAQ